MHYALICGTYYTLKIDQYVSLCIRRRRTVLSSSCPCLVFVRIFHEVMSAVCLLFGFSPLSGFTTRLYTARLIDLELRLGQVNR